MDNIEIKRKNLPIFSIRNKLLSEIQRNASLILLGETGCGKTTQIPQYIYESQTTMKGMIACTQPRRVAAITVAMRVSNEINCELGTTVGYTVRFEDVTSSDTKIKYMTDGMLLRESLNDALLLRYSVVILDEIHERTLHTDILMGIVKQAQKERVKKGLKQLKLILMSATMDVDQFSKYFNNAPVLYLEGRQHKVDVFHSSLEQNDYLNSAIQTVFQIHRLAPLNEDILVFLTGQEEIESTCRTINDINKKSLKNTLPMIVLPFYAALPSNKQLKVFEDTGDKCRKVILSTNIAETSLTIPRIKYVVDTGMIKAKIYTPESNLEILKVHKISKSQAWQRTGRAGREQPGICYRLYTEPQYEGLPLNTIPEILRSNLAAVILQLLAIGIRDALNFDFMDKPSEESLEAAINELELLDAVKKSNEENVYELTDLGRQMSQFPLDPKYSRCIIAAANISDCKCVEEVIKILSLLSVDTVFQQVNNQSKRETANTIRQKFVSSDGDHITLLNVYKAYNASKSRKEWCHENFIEFKNMKLASEIRKQLRDICVRENIAMTSNSNDTVAIRRAMVYGFFMNSAEYSKENEFKTITSRQTVQIHPSSVLFNSKPMFVLFNELVHTNKTYMRDVSVLSSDWLLDCNPNYFKSKLKRTQSS